MCFYGIDKLTTSSNLNSLNQKKMDSHSHGDELKLWLSEGIYFLKNGWFDAIYMCVYICMYIYMRVYTYAYFK